MNASCVKEKGGGEEEGVGLKACTKGKKGKLILMDAALILPLLC